MEEELPEILSLPEEVVKKIKLGLDNLFQLLYSNIRTRKTSSFGEVPKLAEGAPLERE